MMVSTTRLHAKGEHHERGEQRGAVGHHREWRQTPQPSKSKTDGANPVQDRRPWPHGPVCTPARQADPTPLTFAEVLGCKPGVSR